MQTLLVSSDDLTEKHGSKLLRKMLQIRDKSAIRHCARIEITYETMRIIEKCCKFAKIDWCENRDRKKIALRTMKISIIMTSRC